MYAPMEPAKLRVGSFGAEVLAAVSIGLYETRLTNRMAASNSSNRPITLSFRLALKAVCTAMKLPPLTSRTKSH